MWTSLSKHTCTLNRMQCDKKWVEIEIKPGDNMHVEQQTHQVIGR